jgi:hypothetical protein
VVSVQRRLNSTGRTRITRDRVNITIEPSKDLTSPVLASASINLDGLDFPREANVVIEAYYRSSSMRFACGTVSVLAIPQLMELTDIDRGGAIQFRVLVTASDSSGRILASADGLRPAKQGEGADRQPLLPLRETDLGNELWKVTVDFSAGPTLLVNNRIPGLATNIRTLPLFQGLILPHAFRTVLQNLGAPGEDEGDDNWGGDWRKFLHTLGVAAEPDEPNDDDSKQEWIDEAVEVFCNSKDFVGRVRISVEAQDSSYV